MKIGRDSSAMSVLKTGRDSSVIFINGKELEQVEQFKYFGSNLTSNGKCFSENRARVAMAKNNFNKKKELLTKSLNINLKLRIIKTLMRSMLL